MIGRVAEQGEWRHHSVGQNPAKQGIRIRRTLDEYSVRLVVS